MPTELTGLRVFIASPSGLTKERKAFRDEIREFNEAYALARGVLFLAIGWEDTLGGVGRPQMLINEEIQTADYFLLLLWDSWGTAPSVENSKYTSGTEEEYHVAMQCYREEKSLHDMLLMFKSVGPHQLSDQGPELKKVIEFRQRIEQEKTLLFKTFDSTESFKRIVRKHLSAWLLDFEHEKESGVGGRSAAVRLRTISAASAEPGVSGLVVAPDISPGGAVASEPTKVHHRGVTPEVARAWALADAGRQTEAEVAFAKAVVGHSEPWSMIEYGLFLNRLGRFDQARVMFEGAVTAAKESNDRSAIARAYRAIGKGLEIRSDLAAAERMYGQALELHEELGEHSQRVADAVALGEVLNLRGDPEAAEAIFRKALEVDSRLVEPEYLAGVYANLGGLQRNRGLLDDAEKYFRKALELQDQAKNPSGTAAALGNIATVLVKRGDFAGAEALQRKAIALDEQIGSLQAMARDYGNLGITLKEKGDLEEALAMQRKAFEINQRLGRSEGMAINYTNMASVIEAQGDLEGAEKKLRQSLEVNSGSGRIERLTEVYEGLGRILNLKGDVLNAEQMYSKALEAARRLGSAEAVKGIGKALAGLKRASS